MLFVLQMRFLPKFEIHQVAAVLAKQEVGLCEGLNLKGS
jgi:hypothetical protein